MFPWAASAKMCMGCPCRGLNVQRYTVSITSISLETLRPTVNHHILYIQGSNMYPDLEHISTVRIEITSDGIDAKVNEILMNMPQG